MAFIKKADKLNTAYCLLLLVLMIASFTSPPKEINYTQFSNDVIDRFCGQAKEKYGLTCSASGGSFPHDIQSIHLQLLCEQPLNREKAREVEVNVIEDFLNMINSEKAIRPYLREHPFTADRVYISIHFTNKKKDLKKNGELISVFQARNLLFYRFNDTKNPLKYRTEQENYNEALIKVQNAHSACESGVSK